MRSSRETAVEVGGGVLVIDVKNERASEWYASHVAVPLLDAPLTLLLPLATIEAALKKAGKLGKRAQIASRSSSANCPAAHFDLAQVRTWHPS